MPEIAETVERQIPHCVNILQHITERISYSEMYSTWCMTRSPGDQLQCGAILPQTSRCSTVESQHRTFPTLLRNNTDNCGTAVFLHCTLLKHIVSPFVHPNLVWRVKHRNISLDPAVLAVVSDRAPPGPGLSRALRCQWMQVQSFLSGHLFTHIQHSLYEIMIPPFHKDTKKSRKVECICFLISHSSLQKKQLIFYWSERGPNGRNDSSSHRTNTAVSVTFRREFHEEMMKKEQS